MSLHEPAQQSPPVGRRLGMHRQCAVFVHMMQAAPWNSMPSAVVAGSNTVGSTVP